MELKGKKIAFLGDSITEGVGVSCVENTYWSLLARKTGAQCFGYGIGGTRIAPQLHPSPEPRWDLYFGSRVEEMADGMDVVVVFGGTNDFGHGDANMGSMSDRGEKTFYGSFHELILKLIRKYPGADIVLMTPLHRVGDEDCSFNEFGVRRQSNLEGYADAIRRIAAYYGIPMLDLFRTSGIQPNVPELMETFAPDGLHPNDTGHERMCQRLIGFLSGL